MKFMKKSVIAMLVGVVAFGAVGCSSSSETSEGSTQLDQIKEKGVLVIGTSADYPPYEFHKTIDGKDTIVGMDIDVANAIADEIGVELEIKDMKFDGILGSLNAGQVDLGIAGFSPTEERKKAVNFSDIYYNGKSIILTTKDKVDKYKTLEDLKDAPIATQKASLQENMAKDQIEATNIKSLGKISELVMDLNNGNVDAIIIGETAAKGYMKEYPNLVEAEAKLEDDGEGVAIAVKKSEDNSLVDVCNDVLGKLKEEGKIEEFVQKATELSQE